jgi:hypothetical protein
MHEPSAVGSFSYWFDKPWFHTEGRLAAVLIIPSSWGSQLGGHLHVIKQFSGAIAGIEEEEAPTSTTHQQFFWRRCRGERGFLQGESLASNLFTLLLFCFILFLLAYFYQKYKKN